MRKKVWTALALALTPYILFLLTSLDLWCRNFSFFGADLEVLLPFVGLFFLTWLLGLAIFALARFWFFRFLLWGYLLAGPVFLIVSVFREFRPGLFGSPGLILATLGSGLVLAAILTWKTRVSRILGALALVFLGLLIFNGYQAAALVIDLPDLKAKLNVGDTGSTNLPNIYHIILDEYQTDLFDLTLTSEVKKELGGFVYFPQNKAVYGRSETVVPAIFLGSLYDYVSGFKNWRSLALSSEQSFLYWLRRGGYATSALIYARSPSFGLEPMYSDQRFFEEIVEYQASGPYLAGEGLKQQFWYFWLFQNTPRFLGETLIPKKEFEELQSPGAVFDPKVVIRSYYGFQEFLKQEESLPAFGRYAFLYLDIPHFPNVLQSNCTFTVLEGVISETSAGEQSECATKVLLDFVSFLKRVGRFDSSLVIIQADTGSRYQIEDGEPVNVEPKGFYSEEWIRARSSALLLIKPPRAQEEFAISLVESTTLDLAPTILATVGIESEVEYEGVNLLDPANHELKRKRYFEFYDKKGRTGGGNNEWSRYLIEDGQIRFEQTVFVKP